MAKQPSEVDEEEKASVLPSLTFGGGGLDLIDILDTNLSQGKIM